MSNEPRAGQGIDPELLAAYVDQRLSPEQRADVEARLVADPESYAVMIDTLKALDDGAIAALRVSNRPGSRSLVIEPRRKASLPKAWKFAGGLLAAAASALLIVRIQGGLTDTALRQIAETVDEHRTIEAPLAGGFAYRPFSPRSRAGVDEVPSSDWDLLAIVTEAEEQARAGRPDHHLLGVGYLLLGRTDLAIRELEQAVNASSAHADVEANYAAALLHRGLANGAPADLAAALNAADRSLALDSGHRQALFTRALILEALGDSRARDAWNRYLSIDADSPWSREASEHLARLK